MAGRRINYQRSRYRQTGIASGIFSVCLFVQHLSFLNEQTFSAPWQHRKVYFIAIQKKLLLTGLGENFFS